MYMDEIMGNLEQHFEETILNEFKEGDVTKIRLDPRSSIRKAWYSECKDTLILKVSSEGNLNYYGGFEYIKEDERAKVGDYLIFDASNERAAEVIASMTEENEEESEAA